MQTVTHDHLIVRGFVDYRTAMFCLEEDCAVVFDRARWCPACGSAQIKPLAAWLDRIR